MPVYDDLGNMTNELAGEVGREMGDKVDELLDALFDEGMTIVEARALVGYLKTEINYVATLNFMQRQIQTRNDPVSVEVQGSYPICLDTKCPHKKECANHTSAGDCRIEDGDTPNLVKTDKGWQCNKEPGDDGWGAILTDGTYTNEQRERDD